MDANFNQAFDDPSMANMPPNFIPQNQFFIPPPVNLNRGSKPKQRTSVLSRIPSLHLPAIILFAFSWVMHTIATFIPYWSIYPNIVDARAGLWSARNFNYTTIQNFYFPESTDFPTITNSIRFTTANTKGYIVTVQFLMTFNFVLMTIVLCALLVDYFFSGSSSKGPRSVLIREYNASDTAIIYGLLLYILYVFTVFEFAAWITYVGSRHDNNWHMHASFALTVIVSVFLMIVFFMYVIEFLKIFRNNRLRWEYWYGPYAEWAFFVHLSALLLLLIVICCPEWAYDKYSPLFIFAEIGLFKQCYLSTIYKKSLSSTICTLSSSSSNRSWVNATQAFMLMAYIFGMIFLGLMIAFRKEFRHNPNGYDSSRVSQPTFTYVLAGLILFFCFIFSLIGVSIFGGEVFKYSITVNWGYIVAVFAMVLFLIAGILLILDGIHSEKQKSTENASPIQKFFFPEPLNNRVLLMEPLIKPKPPRPPPPVPLMVPPTNFPPQQSPILPMYPGAFFPPQATIMPANYGMEPYPVAPIAQATLSNYFQQMVNNPQFSSSPFNLGLGSYSAGNQFANRNDIAMDDNLNELVRLHLLQQQRLNYNHERLLEQYSRIQPPYASGSRGFGNSTLPGRNYDEYLQGMGGNNNNDFYGNSLAAQSRAGIKSSGETYRWMGDENYEPLSRGVNSSIQHSRNDPRPFVNAERFEPGKVYKHPIFGLIPTYIRLVFTRTKTSKKRNENDDHNITDRIPSGYPLHQNQKIQNEHIIPVNPDLFNMYNQRLNGSIQGYGQSFYIPSSRYEEIVPLSRSHVEPILINENHKSLSPPLLSSSSFSSKEEYSKLQSQMTVTTTLNQTSQPLSTDDEISLPNFSNTHLSRNKSNLLSSAPVTSHITLPTSKNLSVVNNAGLVRPSRLVSPQPELRPLSNHIDEKE